MPRPYTPRGDRTINESRKGRVLWRPGKPHPLDVLFEEAKTLRDELPGQLQEMLTSAQRVHMTLQTVLEMEQQFDDPAAPISAADRAAFQAVTERFHNRKHLDHLEAVFAVVRRRRLAGRLQAIQAALDLAAGLLAEEESLSQEFLQAVQQAQVNALKDDAPVAADDLVPDIEEQSEQGDEDAVLPPEEDEQGHDAPLEQSPSQRVYPLLSKEEERVLNLTEPLTPLVTGGNVVTDPERTIRAISM